MCSQSTFLPRAFKLSMKHILSCFRRYIIRPERLRLIRLPRQNQDSASLRKLSDFRLLDRKSTRLNTSHITISYAVFCCKKKDLIGKDIAMKQQNYANLASLISDTGR